MQAVPHELNNDWSSTSGVAQAWLHGLALVRLNHTSAEPSDPMFSEAMHRLHGPSGLWTSAMGNRFHELGLKLGEKFEYDPQRGCRFWNPMTCYTAPSFLNKLVKEMPASTSPVIILEVRPFLGAASIGLANALTYQE